MFDRVLNTPLETVVLGVISKSSLEKFCKTLRKIQRRIYNPLKHLRWSFLKQLTVFCKGILQDCYKTPRFSL